MKVLKRALILCLFLVLAAGLAACASSPASSYTVTRDGVSYTVDTQASTISDSANSYQYTLSAGPSGYEIQIVYPDGSQYWWNVRETGGFGSGYGGWSDDYDPDRYVDGSILCDILEGGNPTSASRKSFNPIALLILAVGLFNLLYPYGSWYLSHGWKYKNAEPSDAALALNRLGGAVALVIAILMIFL